MGPDPLSIGFDQPILTTPCCPFIQEAVAHLRSVPLNLFAPLFVCDGQEIHATVAACKRKIIDDAESFRHTPLDTATNNKSSMKVRGYFNVTRFSPTLDLTCFASIFRRIAICAAL